MDTWHWPQWVIIFWLIAKFIMWVWEDARKDDGMGLVVSIMLSVLYAWILWMGGFWS